MSLSLFRGIFQRVGRGVNYRSNIVFDLLAVGSIVFWTLQDLFIKLLRSSLLVYKRNSMTEDGRWDSTKGGGGGGGGGHFSLWGLHLETGAEYSKPSCEHSF